MNLISEDKSINETFAQTFHQLFQSIFAQDPLAQASAFPSSRLISGGMLWQGYPSSLNLLSKQQNMNTELTDSTKIEQIIPLIMIDPKATKAITHPASFFVLSFNPTHKQAMTHGIPTEMIIPQNTRRLLISLVTEKSGKSLHTIPIAVLAESMKSYPVTAMQMIVLWFRIFSKASICLSKQDIMHKQTATARFLASFFFESMIILAKVTIEIKRAANVMAPRADLYIHWQAVLIGFLLLTLQYQKAQVTATVKTIMQQKKKLQNSQKSIQTPVRILATDESCLWSSCQSPFWIIKLKVYPQNPANKIVRTTLIMGVRKMIGLSAIKVVATLTNTIPVWIFFLKQNKMHVQINNMTPIIMASAQFWRMIPMRQRPPIKPREEKIMTLIIPLGASLISKMYPKLAIMEMMVQTMMGAFCRSMSKELSLTQGLMGCSQSALVAMKQPPMARKAVVMRMKTRRQKGLLSFLSLTGWAFQSWQVELQRSRYSSQSGGLAGGMICDKIY